LAPDTITEKYIKFLDIHPKELARQLTLISQDRILRITSRELTELVKSKCIVKDFKVPCIGAAYSHMKSVSLNPHQLIEYRVVFIPFFFFLMLNFLKKKKKGN